MNKPIRILLADDHQMFLESMSMLLKTIEGIELVATATNGKDAVRFLDLYEVDIVICDFQMPLMSGLEVILELRKRLNSSMKVLILTMLDDVLSIKAAIQAGADGYLLKTANKSELQTAILAIANGGTYFGSNVMLSLSKSTTNEELTHEKITLSDRELEILKLIVKEFSSTEIAEKLFISFNTVETHRKNIYKKLGVNSSLGLLKYAFRNGLAE